LPQPTPDQKLPTGVSLWNGTKDQFLLRHDNRIVDLAQKFNSYGQGIDKISIIKWLGQFEHKHLPIALKLLETVDYYGPARVLYEFKESYKQLVQLEGPDLSNKLFASFGYPGHSGDEMIYKFRLTNQLADKRWNVNFLYLSDIGSYIDRNNLTFVFINDFVGSGKQAVETWENVQGFVSEKHAVYLIVMAAYQEGMKRINEKTRLRVVANRTLGDESKVFSERNPAFSLSEKTILSGYCQRAGGVTQGYGGIQSLIIFHYRAPNNSIPILWCNNRRWKGLFVRNP